MKKVLIVEDDLTIARIYQGLLRMEGTEAEVAADGEIALQMLRDYRPDLVLLDLMLPKVNGVEVIKRIRSAPAICKLPVIVFSNAYLGNVVQDAWKAGATRCVVKAQTAPKQLLELIRNTLAAAESPPPAAEITPAAVAANVVPHPAVAEGPRLRWAGNEKDVTFQSEIRQALLNRAPAIVADFRAGLHSVAKAETEDARIAAFHELCRTTHALTSNAGIVGFRRVAQMSSALSALFKEFHEKPARLNPSCLRTIAQAVDCFEKLFDQAAEGRNDPMTAARILVVDDEVISRRVLCSALARANLPAMNLDDPSAAIKLLEANHFDLVFLDVDMPGTNGFDLCKKLRATTINKSTPVVFVTGLTDFESRALSIMSGGNDLIAKPFSFLELAVKALTYVLGLPAKAPESPDLAATSQPDDACASACFTAAAA